MADLPWRKAIIKVLSENDGAMHYKDVADQIVASELRKSVGATPAATVRATFATSINRDGEKSPFQRTGTGEFILRETITKPVTKSTISNDESEPEEQYAIVTSFGMFWRRDLVDWCSMPNLLGMQQIGTDPVNFQKQLGIYLLYDGREVIYVGRSTDRPLGRRLYEHTVDRLSTRWDRFSWFGLLPVSENGELGSLPDTYDATKLTPALEAILIEALEPRQNRKRGDDLAVVEYLQKEDPEVERKKKKALLEAALAKV